MCSLISKKLDVNRLACEGICLQDDVDVEVIKKTNPHHHHIHSFVCQTDQLSVWNLLPSRRSLRRIRTFSIFPNKAPSSAVSTERSHYLTGAERRHSNPHNELKQWPSKTITTSSFQPNKYIFRNHQGRRCIGKDNRGGNGECLGRKARNRECASLKNKWGRYKTDLFLITSKSTFKHIKRHKKRRERRKKKKTLHKRNPERT